MRNLILMLFFLLSLDAVAQDFGYGFKTGLNFSSFRGDGETDDSGKSLEKYETNTGFHVGASFAWKATDLMGVRTELLFAQMGSNREFDGGSYYIFNAANGNRIFTGGQRKMALDVTNSYIIIPAMGYYKPLSWLELSAGASVSFLIASNAFGEITYSGTTASGAAIAEFNHEIDANYYTNEPLGAEFPVEPETVQVGSEVVPLPNIAGAYFEFDEDQGKLYKTIDAGLIGGVSLYISKGLFLGFRAQYGLTDVTKSKADVSLFKLDGDNQFISREDKDKNLSLQVSVGFAF